MSKAATQQFILLPPRGLTAGVVTASTPATESFLASLEKVRLATNQTKALSTAKVTTKLRFLDSINENGAKLIEISPDDLSDLAPNNPDLRVVRSFTTIQPRLHAQRWPNPGHPCGGGGGGLTLKVGCRTAGHPCRSNGGRVYQFRQARRSSGDEGQSGSVAQFPGSSVKLEPPPISTRRVAFGTVCVRTSR